MFKKGGMLDLFILIIIGFVCILFFTLWMYGHGLITSTLEGIDTGSATVNISDAATKTFGNVDAGLSQLHLIAFIMIVGMALSILMSNFLVKAHPAFFIVYVLITILAIIFAVYISNTYEDLTNNEIIGLTLKGFTAGSFIMLNLPIFITFIGIFGAILLFVGISRDYGSGGSPI